MKDVRRLTLEQLRAFVSVVESSSFTAAAREQMRTQTAITRQLKNMEDILGQRLVKRSRGHVAGVTDAGERLLPFARKALDTVDDALAAINRSHVSGSIRIGIMDDVDIGWLNELVNRFKQAQPDCEVRAISDFSARLELRLENQEIDIAIVKTVRTDTKVTGMGVLRREPLVWAAGPGFRCEPSQPLPLVVFHQGCAYRERIIDQLQHMGFRSFIAYEGQSYANVLAAAYAGFGITALAESQITAGGLLRMDTIGMTELVDLGTVEIVIKYQAKQASPALSAFAREIGHYMPGRIGYAP